MFLVRALYHDDKKLSIQETIHRAIDNTTDMLGKRTLSTTIYF